MNVPIDPLPTDSSGELRLPGGRFGGPGQFSSLIRSAFAAAASQGWQELLVSDPDFSDWPLGEQAVVQSLHDWARSGRQFTMLATSYDDIQRRHARFVAWRKTWSHRVECRVAKAGPADELLSALWSPLWVLHRLDRAHCVGVSGSEPGRRVLLREKLNERLLRSSPGFAATTLGL